MSIFGDEPTKASVSPQPGEDLYGLSVAELTERIAVYQAEITRLEAERVKKAKEQDAAHALFGKKS
ncbi:DUF1192 domain-containing protein [Litorimonas sp. WD9-15]|uniref:DUF1192 domain-containing protein n=1 Tax=Litorimonas sp. WD9-15 TaxID=3418716 RepID=UPI003D011BB8